jgi:DDE superfamily endonuclease
MTMTISYPTMSDIDILLLVILLSLIEDELDDLVGNLESVLVCHIREQKCLNRSLPASKTRVRWHRFVEETPPTHFRHMFRMSEGVFEKLCKCIESTVSEEVFQPEAYLIEEDIGTDHKIPPICGEVKLAVTIRMLVGGSYLDLFGLFGVGTTHLYNTFHQVVQWILLTFEFPLVKWLREQNWAALESLALDYAKKTGGVFYGPFGSLDGIAVIIQSPTLDEVSDPGNYYCRKGFYALNIQAICDKKKHFLCCYPSNKGSTHDSAAFTNSRLFDLLLEMTDKFVARGLFLVGDTAYRLCPFLITALRYKLIGLSIVSNLKL